MVAEKRIVRKIGGGVAFWRIRGYLQQTIEGARGIPSSKQEAPKKKREGTYSSGQGSQRFNEDRQGKRDYFSERRKKVSLINGLGTFLVGALGRNENKKMPVLFRNPKRPHERGGRVSLVGVAGVRGTVFFCK